MDIPTLGLKERKTLVILGAGATRGGTFVAADAPAPPPLDRDFFRILQISRSGQLPESRSLIDVDLKDNSERVLADDEILKLKPGKGFGKKVSFKRG